MEILAAALPIEIIDKIISYLPFKVAYCLNNGYAINRHIKQFIDNNWDYIFYNADGYLIWYLHKNKLKQKELSEFKRRRHLL